MVELNSIYNQDCTIGMSDIEDSSVDCILTDPPYLYLKNQKLDRAFNEEIFFQQCNRVLKKDGMIVLFGRGTSFYRWNTILADMKFKFKEEIIWDKQRISSPLMAISRLHETISIHSKRDGAINRVKIPYVESQQYDMRKLISAIEHIQVATRNPKFLHEIKEYLEKGEVGVRSPLKQGVTIASHLTSEQRHVSFARSINNGMNERSIIKELRISGIHPTQKPVRLLERLLALTTQEGDIVVDPFGGSGSTAAACINTNRNYISFEIDKEFYEAAANRLNSITQNKIQFKS